MFIPKPSRPCKKLEKKTKTKSLGYSEVELLREVLLGLLLRGLFQARALRFPFIFLLLDRGLFRGSFALLAVLEERSQSFIPLGIVVRLPKERRVDGPGDEERAERQRDEVRLRPAFVVVRHRVALTEDALREIRVLQSIPAARVAARVDYARVLGKFPVPVDAGGEDLAADAHGFFVGGWLHAMVSRRRRSRGSPSRRPQRPSLGA